MNNRTIVSGFSAMTAYANDTLALINNLKQGIRVTTDFWFESSHHASHYGLDGNKQVAKFKSPQPSLEESICQLLAEALSQAKLDESCLSSARARVYLTGLGPRIDVDDYRAFYDHNDAEDIKINPTINHLHAAQMSQDKLSRFLANRYHLHYSPPNFHCSSNSALAAVHLATQAVRSGEIDLVVVINCSIIRTQDIVFLAEQSMLEGETVQPFGQDCNSVLFAEGYSVLVLESDTYRTAREMATGISLNSCYRQINSSRGNNAAQLTNQIVKTIQQAMSEAGIELQDLSAIMPHANGTAASDKAEAQAIISLLAEQAIPILAYKGQVGYTTTGSGIIDIIIAHHSLIKGELIPAKSFAKIRGDMQNHLLMDTEVRKHNKQHLLKFGLGVDGSIIAVVMSVGTTLQPTN